MKIRRSTFRKLVAGLAVAVLAAITVTVVSASNVTIQTPSIGTEQLEIEGKVIGTYPVYDGGGNTTVTWPAYVFPPGSSGSYRLSIWQNTTPLEASPTWREIHISHHWASNPAPTTFTFGPFLASEQMCETCPSMIVVQPETYNTIVDDNGVTSYAYFPIVGAFTSGPVTLTQSDEVLFHGIAASACKGPSCGATCANAWEDYCMDECFPDEECFDECMDEGDFFCAIECSELPSTLSCKPCGDGFCSYEEYLEQSCGQDCGGN